MRTNNTHGKRKFLALFLSVMMVSSMAAFASCTESSSSSSDSSSSSSSTETTPKDSGIIKNAKFQTFDTNDGLNLIGTSATGWTRSVNSTTSGSALSSKAASGIIDTAATEWDNLTKSNLGSTKVEDLTEAQAEAKWKDMSAKDKLEYYEAWKDANDDSDDDVKDLSFYQAFNVDAEDLPTTANPLTHDYDAATNKEAAETKVLMIHNEYSSGSYNSFGTAQKFTSSTTVTVPAGSNATFSVWVKTSDLTSTSSGGEEQAAVNKGAYIHITHTIGSTTLDPLEIKNINTEGVTANNGWVQYSFFLESSSFVDSTFTIVLGLGQGGGTDRSEYVNGYAFFDDIECTIDPETYADDYKAAAPTSFTHRSEASVKVINATENDKKAFALDFAAAAESKDWPILKTKDAELKEGEEENSWKFAPTTEKRSGKEYTAAAGVTGVETYQGLGIDTKDDKTNVYKVSELANGGDYLSAIYTKNFQNSTFLSQDDKMLMMFSANGAAWTATSSVTDKITVKADSYMAISFYVKTSFMNGLTGAGVTLVDGTSKTSISSIDTTTSETKNEDGTLVNDGWQKCYYFISNGTSKDLPFSLYFTFGPTTVVDTTSSSYYTGYAAFTKFEIYDFGTDETAYEYATSGTYTKIVTLLGENDEAAGDSGFDSPASVPTDAIRSGFANPTNYKGVYSDSDYVKANGTGENASINMHATTGISAGLLSKSYVTLDEKDELGNKLDNTAYTTLLSKFTTNGTTAKDKWDYFFGEDTSRPLIIYNDKAQTKAYGYIGKSTTIAASSYATVSLRVKTNATAYVYLVDMTDDGHETMLSVNGNRVYWYDADGNVCAMDPSDSAFSAKKHTAFRLQSNGLYKVDATWNKESGANLDVNKYYANLAAYGTDSNGNLVVAEGGVSYDYTNKWQYDGNDGIAFYAKKEGETTKYYADSAKTVEVTDLASVDKLTARYEATKGEDMFFKVTDTKGDWATVTFHIHAGDVEKNYRLEVWSGERKEGGDVNKNAGDYVIFDSYSPDAVDDKFATLIEQRQSEIDDNDKLGNYFESVFSFYDTNKFLRYDETIDENGVGNSYTSYLSSNYSDGIAFLKYAKDNVYEMYADYTLSEMSVTADVKDDTSSEDNETDDTTSEATSPFLLISSIAIAVVLLFAVISIIIRKVVLKNRKNRGEHAYEAKKNKK